MADLADALEATDSDRLDQAEAVVRAYCGWHIAPSRSATATYLAVTDKALFLPSMHVTAITSVTVDGVAIDAADFNFTSGGVLTRAAYGGYWWGTVVVVFVHGYEFPPADVSAVVQSLAQRAASSPGGRAVTQVGAVSFGSSDGTSSPLQPDVGVLNAYRLPALA